MTENKITENTIPEHESEGSEVGVVDRSELLGDLYDESADEEEMWAKRDEGAEEMEKADFRDPAEIRRVLEDSAQQAQKFAICGLRRVYTRGRAYIDRYVQPRSVTNQKRIELTSYMTVTDYRVPELVEKLKRGRVVTRLGAVPGLGKTTRIPAEIAVQCGLRVCQVELNAHVSQLAWSRQRATYNVKGHLSKFSREPGAYLTCMSYDDFRGYVCSALRKRLFQDFDVFYFDESHDTGASVFLALQYFAIYSQGHNSLIVASATVSTDETNNIVSKRVGDFKEARDSLSVRQAFDTGKMFREYLRDRSMILVASDADVWYARDLYIEQGIDAMMLDSASTLQDVENVVNHFTEASLVPRVLVALHTYGTGYNFPVSYVVTAAKRSDLEWSESGVLIQRSVPLSDHEVTQHKGRTGRAMVPGSGGFVLSSERVIADGLRKSERISAYLGLVAGDIKPLSSQWADVAQLMPRGITRDVAQSVLSVALPPMLVLRYLGTDGLVASSFLAAMTFFCEPDHYLRPSKDEFPIGYEDWKSERYGGYIEGDDAMCDFEARVPFSTPDSLRAAMHALYAVSKRLISMERWRPDTIDDDISGSEDEVSRPKIRRRVVMPRMIVDVEKKESVAPSVPEKDSWRFDVAEEDQAKRKRRVARDWTSSPGGIAAVEELKRAVEGIGTIGVVTAGVSVAQDDDRKVDVRSPGGSVTIRLAARLYRTLLSGKSLSLDQLLSLLSAYQACKGTIVESALFANWGPPWLSLFETCLSYNVVEGVTLEGQFDVLTSFVQKLYDRFRQETIEVCKTSNIYASKFSKFLGSKPSLTGLTLDIRKGKLRIAQSDTFISKVLEIKELHDSVLLAFEKHGQFVPDQITSAQRRLPLRDRHRRLSVIDRAMAEQPRGLFNK